MNDITRARLKREKQVELVADREVRDAASAALNALPAMTPDKQVMALVLGVLALSDRIGADRKNVAKAFALVARKVGEIETVNG